MASEVTADVPVEAKPLHDNQGYVAVKPEFVAAPATPSVAPALSADGGSASDTKTRFAKRPRDEVKPLHERMCTGTVIGTGCPFGESCKYSHDVKAFMAERPPDLGPTCVVYDLFGHCRMGAMCRFGGGHINPVTGENLTRPPEAGGVVTQVDEINELSKEAQVLLRKNKFPFKTARKSAGDSGGASSAAQEQPTMSLEPLPSRPVKLVDFSNKVYIAPLTTVGNLPFRRIMKKFGADITCGEMAMCTNLLAGQASEWALLRRHPSEDIFGVQIAAAHPDQFGRCAELLEEYCTLDFVDVNCGCPIDLVCDKGAGSSLMTRPKKIVGLADALTKQLTCPITIKMRIGWNDNKPVAHQIIRSVEELKTGRISAFMIHGRSRLQRYSSTANWNYIASVGKGMAQAEIPPPSIPIIGNGDIYNFEEWEEHVSAGGVSSCCMLARGALIKPWLPTEIKEKRHWDISASERLDMLKSFANFGLEHWGSDQKGVNNTRRFLLEWLSFLHRYIPVGVLETLPSKLTDRAPPFCGRSDLEVLMGSKDSGDWVKLTEMVLGPVPDGFKFLPKHKANATVAATSAEAEANG